MSKTITIIDGCKLTVRRPNGTIDIVISNDHSRNGVIPADKFAAMVEATRAAGRGDIIKQEPNQKVIEVSLQAQREELSCRLMASVGAYPGSAAWRAGKQAEADLAAFDAEYPEVAAALVAARAARHAGTYQD